MDASFDHHSPLRSIVPGRYTRVSVQTPAGEIEARLSERGNWELRVRRDQETNCRGRPDSPSYPRAISATVLWCSPVSSAISRSESPASSASANALRLASRTASASRWNCF
jgi:hypothetical protein